MSRVLKGQLAVVTGAGSGIGRAISLRLAADGARVVATDLDAGAAAGVAAAIQAAGGAAEWAQLDVLDLAGAQALVERLTAGHGRIDIWCGNAGVSTMNHVWELSEAEWDFNMDVNAKGVFLCTKAVLPQMIRQRAGRIIITASMAGLRGAPLLAHYAASKWAVVGFVRSVAMEVGKYGVTINCVCPGFVRTPMQDREVVWEGTLRDMAPAAVRDEYVTLTPLGRMEEPEDVARAVAFLAGPDAAFMTGVALPVTGGADLP